MLDNTWEFVDSYATASLLLHVHLDRIQQEAALSLTKAEALNVLRGPIHYVAGRCSEGTSLEELHQKLTPYVEAVLAMSEQELALEAKEPDFSKSMASSLATGESRAARTEE